MGPQKEFARSSEKMEKRYQRERKHNRYRRIIRTNKEIYMNYLIKPKICVVVQ